MRNPSICQMISRELYKKCICFVTSPGIVNDYTTFDYGAEQSQLRPLSGKRHSCRFKKAPLGEAASRRFGSPRGSGVSPLWLSWGKRRPAALALLGEAASRRFGSPGGSGVPPLQNPYGTCTHPASPPNPFAADGAKYTHAPPVNDSAFAAEVGITTVVHVAL